MIKIFALIFIHGGKVTYHILQLRLSYKNVKESDVGKGSRATRLSDAISVIYVCKGN